MRTKKQLWFNTDLDYYATEQLLHDSPEVVILNDWKGRLTFSLKGVRKVNCQITAHGKFSIAFPLEKDPEKWLSLVRRLLVRKNGDPIVIFEKYKEIPEPKEKITPLEEKVEKAIHHLRFLLMRDPTTTEIAYDVGETPEKMREIAFKLAPKLKWKEPSEEDIKGDYKKLSDIYQIASLLNHFKADIVLRRPTKFLQKVTPNKILNRANYAREHEKENLPQVGLVKETDKFLEYSFYWSGGSKYCFGDISEFYDKDTETLSGQNEAFMKKIKHVWELTKKSLNNIGKED